MARPRKQRRISDDADPGEVAIRAQARLFELRRDRDEQLAAAAAEADEAFDELEARLEAHNKTQGEGKARKQAERVAALLAMVERRQAIEEKMRAVGERVNQAARDFEALMLAGLEGRIQEVDALVQSQTE